MSRTRLWSALLLVSLLATALIAAGCGGDDDDSGTSGDVELIEEGTLTIGTDTPYPPFELGDPPDYEGFDIDLINAVADCLELDLVIEDVPFDVVLAGGNGKFDLAIAATSIKPAREKRVDFSDPYFEAEQSLLVQSGGDVQSAEDLAGKTVGAQDATTGETYALEETDAADVRPFPEIDDAFTALSNGQVDAVINDLPTNQAATEDNPDLEVVETYETGEQYGIVFPQGTGALLDETNSCLEEIKDDGTLADIYQTWFEKDPPESVLSATHEAS